MIIATQKDISEEFNTYYFQICENLASSIVEVKCGSTTKNKLDFKLIVLASKRYDTIAKNGIKSLNCTT